MARKQKTIHYLYKTICDITKRWYIGMHSTSKLDDGYMGSGKRLRYSIRKHGVDNHTKEILEYYDTRELLVEAEVKAITSDMIKDNDCMNLTEGGSGGHGARFLTKEQLIKGGINTQRKYKTEYVEWRKKGGINNITKNGYKALLDNRGDWTGKKHSEETLKKMSESSKGNGKGETNSQFGKCWITNEVESKKIMRGDTIPDGFRLGRTMK
jgi:hypothetical protein